MIPIEVRTFGLERELDEALMHSSVLKSANHPVVSQTRINGEPSGDQSQSVVVLALGAADLNESAVCAMVHARSAQYLDTIVLASDDDAVSAKALDRLNTDYLHILRAPHEAERLAELARTLCQETAERLAFLQDAHGRDSAVGNLRHGVFEIRTLKQARNLSTMLSKACPRPDDAAVGMLELMANAIEHGNLEIEHDEKASLIREGRWTAEIERRMQHGRYVHRVATVSFERRPESIHFTVSDQGRGFDYQQYLNDNAPNASGPNGRGIRIARVISFDSLDYEDGGRTALASIRIDPGTA